MKISQERLKVFVSLCRFSVLCYVLKSVQLRLFSFVRFVVILMVSSKVLDLYIIELELDLL